MNKLGIIGRSGLNNMRGGGCTKINFDMRTFNDRGNKEVKE